jgi:hypothetical protein
MLPMLPGKNWATIMNRALEFLQAVYTNDELPLVTRMRAAMACLPFEAPKLQVTAMVSEQGFAEILERRLKRIAALEASGANAQVVNQRFRRI